MRTSSPPFRYETALASGLSRGRLRERVGNGSLTRLGRGVYGTGTDRHSQLFAAVLRIGGDTAISHHSAAELWELPTLGRRPDGVALSRPRRRTGVEEFPGIRVRHADLPPTHRIVRRGVPVTTPARTVIDLCRSGDFRSGVVVADAALRLGRCTREELRAVASDCAGWPGIRRARRVAEFADARAHTPLESISRVAFHEYGLPRPLLQAEVLSMDIVDFLWEDFAVAGEADGLGKYADIDVVRREKLRQERIEHDGLTVIRWTWQDAYVRPDALAHRVARVLARRGWRPPSDWVW